MEDNNKDYKSSENIGNKVDKVMAEGKENIMNNVDKSKGSIISKIENSISNKWVKLGAVIFIAVFTYLFMSYGWKYMGFQMTTEPDFVSVFSSGEFKPDNVVFLTGKSPMSIGSYAGAITKVDKETGTLYIGVRFNLTGNNTEFRVIYPQTEVKINKIILKKNSSERVVWERPAGE